MTNRIEGVLTLTMFAILIVFSFNGLGERVARLVDSHK
jgi:hypothetical protein